jgi:hypothetical protein
MASGRMSKSLDVSKRQPEAKGSSPFRPNRQKRSFIMIKPDSTSARVEKKASGPLCNLTTFFCGL